MTLGMIPLLAACQQKGTANSQLLSSPNPPASSLLAETPRGNWQHITGVAHFDQQCTIGKEVIPCLKIIGGEDLNDKQEFYVKEPLKELEGVTDNQHLQIVAETALPTPDGVQEIKQVESVAFLYK